MVLHRVSLKDLVEPVLSLEQKARGHVWVRIVLLDIGWSIFSLEQLDNFLNLFLLSYRAEFALEGLLACAESHLRVPEDVLVPLGISACDRK